MQDLATQKIEGEPSHFSWLSQLRMYWEDKVADQGNPDVMVRMMNAEVREAPSRLVFQKTKSKISETGPTTSYLNPINQFMV